MSELIPSITISELKRLKVPQIRELKSVEVFSDGEYLFTVIIGHSDFVSKEFARTQAEALAVKSNIVGGKDLAEVESGTA